MNVVQMLKRRAKTINRLLQRAVDEGDQEAIDELKYFSRLNSRLLVPLTLVDHAAGGPDRFEELGDWLDDELGL